MQTKPKLFCFVLMPFSSEFDDVYQIGIKEACHQAGAYCERVDEQIFTERILDRIYNQIAKADLVIAEMTGRNANVFYEVGYAHALGKPTVLLTREAADIPFDLKHFPHIIYESKLALLREKLTTVVSWHSEHPNTSLEDTSFPLDLLINGQNPLTKQVVLRGGPWINFEVTIYNRSLNHFEENDFKLGLVIGKEVSGLSTGYAETIPKADIGNDKLQYVLRSRRGLMPGEFQAFELSFYVEEALDEKLRDAILRLFTAKGFQDYPFKWARQPQMN